MVSLFCDTNILQDLLARQKEYPASANLVRLIMLGRLNGAISALSIPDLWYVNRRSGDLKSKIGRLTSYFTILPLDETILNQSLQVRTCRDLEDEIQYLSAQRANCTHLITRNKQNFSKCSITVMTPDEFLHT